MNEKELYEKQYNGKKLKNTISFPFLKKIFNKFDLHREDLALNFLPVEGFQVDVTQPRSVDFNDALGYGFKSSSEMSGGFNPNIFLLGRLNSHASQSFKM